ncbi:CDKD-1 [Symbiodinium sp. KB8]|nr:CDKD-1 [Symbiodinium sp. KB8]
MLVPQKDKTTGTPVAIKQISGGSSAFGANLGAIKEIQALREMKHPNIIELIDVFPSDNMVLAVLEFCPSDVETLINDRTILLNLSHVKSILRMLLLGVQECHKVGYMHRDIKPGNMMFGFDGVVKLADFGLAAPYGTGKPQSPEVVTLWYRAPELLFGASYYTEAVDVWAVGCVFAELLLRRPLFPGPPGDTLLQVAEIVRVLGNPSPDGWKVSASEAAGSTPQFGI